MARGRSPQINPPAYEAYPSMRRRLRFHTAALTVGSIPITRACLLSAVCSTAGANSSATTIAFIPVYQSMRVRRVSLWPIGAGKQLPGVQWISETGRTSLISRFSTSTDVLPIHSTPPASSLSSAWFSSSAPAAFINEPLFNLFFEGDTLVTSTDFILDLEVDVVVANDTSSLVTVTCTALAAALNRGVYWLPLDLLIAAGTIGNLALNPLGAPDGFINNNGSKITVTAIARTS